MGDDTPVRIVSGKTYLYQRLAKIRSSFAGEEKPFVLFDALNCREGCLEGTAGIDESVRENTGLTEINYIRAKSKQPSADSPWCPDISCGKRLENLNKRFEELHLKDYLIEFGDKSKSCGISYPTEVQADAIFKSMHKEDEHSRNINCSAYGYGSCREMMTAIHNGFNTRHNCVYSEKEESIFLAKMSFSDQLTDVMNRNAYERALGALAADGRPVGVVIADVNGLKQANDNEGHAAGDRLIAETAHALANEFGREWVFRTGGDEFTVILRDHGMEEIESDVMLVKDYLSDKKPLPTT